MTQFPAILTHTYHPDHGPFGNVCDCPKAEAAALLARRRADPRRYLERRLAVEAWLTAASRRIIQGIRLERPRYLFLGDFADGCDPQRPASVVVPLAAIPAESLTFTYPDSMASFLLSTRSDLAPLRREHHGRLFTLAGMVDLVARIGLPVPRWPREPGALSDGFVEAQLWDDAPIRGYLPNPAGREASGRPGPR